MLTIVIMLLFLWTGMMLIAADAFPKISRRTKGVLIRGFKTETAKYLYDLYLSLPADRKPSGNMVEALRGLEIKYNDVDIDSRLNKNYCYPSLAFHWHSDFRMPEFVDIRDNLMAIKAEIQREARLVELSSNLGREDEAAAMIEALKFEAKVARESNDHLEELTKG